jgi:hypothetical protein
VITIAAAPQKRTRSVAGNLGAGLQPGPALHASMLILA